MTAVRWALRRAAGGGVGASALTELICSTAFTYRDEDQLQEGIAARLVAAGHDVEREVRISATDRLDLLASDVAIEVKLAGPVDRLHGQLARYATSDRVAEFVVVSTRSRHRALPAAVGGKPVTVVLLGGVR